jgi:MvdD family ATP-grasp ribosomal peptide maturase
MKKKILIITHSEDNECIKMVEEALAADNAESFRFDTDTFPTETHLVLNETNKGRKLIISSPRGQFDLANLDAVWYRRMSVAKKIPKEMDKQLRDPSVQESRTVVLGMMNSLDAFTMDPYHRIRVASDKQLQLKIARQVGLEIPLTLTTNHPDEVKTFFKARGGDIVAKALSSFAVVEDGEEKVVFTTHIKKEHLEDLHGLQYSPMTFQENVPKKVELRVTVVGRQIFCAAVDSQSLDKTQYDWRRDGVGLLKEWKAHDLPKEIETKIHTFMDYFQLNYGAIDIIVTPDDRYVFLEINPGGEFFWLQNHSPKFPLGQAIANVLLNKVPRR